MIEHKNYIYDIEIFPNIFMLTCINANANSAIVDAYEQAAIDNNKEHLEILENALGVRCFIITLEYRNDLPLLLSFMKSHKLMIGYNSHNYDNLILDYICMYGQKFNSYLKNVKGQNFNDIMYSLSYNIVSYGSGYDRVFRESYDMQRYKRLYHTFDIQRVLYLDKRFVSLKQVAIMLKWYLIQDLPFDPHETLNLTDELVEKLKFYNINDCLITKKVVDVSYEEVNLRNNISNLYKINVRNESRSGTANKYFLKTYSSAANIHISSLNKLRTYRRVIRIKPLISDKVIFESDRLKDLLWSLNQRVINVGSNAKEDKFAFEVNYGGKIFKLAKGGLHSKDHPALYVSDDEYVYRDADVTSFYPRIILNLRISPEHLDKEPFLEIVEDIVNNRVNSKEMTKKISKALKEKELSEDERKLLEEALETSTTKTEALKIVINALYGKLGDEYSALYDLKAMYETTINGQLFLLMLIEMLSKEGFQNVSANTDGIITKVKRSRIEEFDNICKRWEELTNFQLAFTDYEKYVCYAVNDYIAIKDGFSKSTLPDKDRLKMFVKKKGLFLTNIELDKGYFAPVISKTLEGFYVFNRNVEDTILENKDIYDYCISKKTNSEFNTVFTSVDKNTQQLVEELLQKNNRFYIADRATGGLTKKYKNPKPNKKGIIVEKISMIAKQNIIIFNKFYRVDNFEDYNINYRFYYNEVMKIVAPIQMSTQTLF